MTTVPADIAPRVHINPDTGCWEWTAGLDSDGYAQARFNGRSRLVHIITYERAHGPVPDGLELDHLCRVRHCVRPSHLEAVTHRENVLRGEGVAALAAQATHCPSGHPYEGRNLLVFADGKRRCRACRNARDAAWKRKARQEARDGVVGARR